MAAAARKYSDEIPITDKSGSADIPGDGKANNFIMSVSSETFTKKATDESDEQIVSSSSYILASDLSGDVDRWMNGSNTSARLKTTGIQGSRVPVAQRSTVTAPCSRNSMWYLVAMILPLFSMHNCMMTIRCTPSTVANAAELFVNHLSRMCSRIKAHLQRIARDRLASELFAAAMDVILVVYALGFLFLSLYQATIIG